MRSDIVSPNHSFENRRLILASQSPRRRQLLEWADLDFEVIIVPTDESFPDDLPTEQIPVYIAKQKAIAVEQSLNVQNTAAGKNSDSKETIIIAADTVVVVNDRIIGKPASPEEAFDILSMLSGRLHHVITGVVIKGREEVSFSDITAVEFHNLTEPEIRFYISKYQPYDKAGAYGIQEWIGVTGIKQINGDFYNVMGLPVSRVLQVLKSGRV